MLYALINTDYHLHALRQHGLAELGGSEGVTLITVPHALASGKDTSDFRAVYRFDTPIGRSRMPFTLFQYVSQARAVVHTLKPGPRDTLIFFTEMEWLNHIVVQHFYRHGARTVLLQDGGLGTYVQNSFPESEPLGWRERCVLAAYRLVPGLKRSGVFKFNSVLYPRIPDTTIDAIALYQDAPLQRQVPVRYVRQPARKRCDVESSTVVFLNQPLYYYYQTDEAYLAGLQHLVAALVRGFETVHFKFHPRESDVWKQRIRELLIRNFPTINVIDRLGSMEEMILDYRPGVLASYFSSGALNLEYEGIEPLYLYHLLDDLKDQAAFAGTTRILQSWGYRFVRDDSEICSGYRSGIETADPGTRVDLYQLLSPSNA